MLRRNRVASILLRFGVAVIVLKVAFSPLLLRPQTSLAVPGGEHPMTMSEKSELTCSMAIPPRFDMVGRFSEGIGLAQSGELWGYIDKSGKYVVYPKFKAMGPFSNGLSSVEDVFGKWGYVDKQGKYAIQPKLIFAGQFSDGLAFVSFADKSNAVINSAGSVVIREQPTTSWRHVGVFSEGFAPVQIARNDGYGEKNLVYFLDKTGKAMNASTYNEAHSFSDGLAAVRLASNRWGFVDQAGRLVIQADFSDVKEGFKDGFALVKDANTSTDHWSVIDRTGHYVIHDIPLKVYKDLIFLGEDGLVSINVDNGDPQLPTFSILLDVKSHDYFTISDGVFIGTVEEGLGAYAKRNVFEAGAQAPGQVKFGFVNVQRGSQSNRGDGTTNICNMGLPVNLAEGHQQQVPTVATRVSESGQIEISGGVASGMLLQKITPDYPPIAKAARVSGTVVLQGTISKQGTITNLSVLSGPPMLQQAAMDAVRRWLYRPFLVKNEPVEVRTTINVVFALGQPGN